MTSWPTLLRLSGIAETVDPREREYILGQKQQEEVPMSIALSLPSRNGIILATDSRATSFSVGVITYSDGVRKLYQISDSVGLAYVGDTLADYGRWIIEKFITKYDRKPFQETVDEFCHAAADDISSYLNHLDDDARQSLVERCKNSPLIFLLSGFNSSGNPQTIVAGFPDEGIPFHPRPKAFPFTVVGVVPIAHYWTHRVGMVIDEADIDGLKILAAFLVQETALFTQMVGGRIQMMTITKERGTEIMSETDVDNITDKASHIINNKSLLTLFGMKG
jgi:hypothetical protein